MSYTTFKLAAVAASLALAGTSLGGTAQAATVYKAILQGANQNPPVASPGDGVAFLTVDGDLLTVSATFSNLIGDVAAAHVHCCAAAPTNVGVATRIPSFPSGVTSGSYNHAFDLDAPGTYNAAFVTANGGTAQGARAALLTGLNGGQAYFNIHTTFAPGGEIRGQFALIPEPASWALMIAGFGLAGTAIRWRRSAFRT
ncbi:CHRD domain-containing protein [Phenylobacterium sp. LjRoot164]|uniref:CHRD domain-containing protein n=1 Tax=unclassified Phenylobacterium TaxID=2640670 RepID=UPI003ECDFF18